MSQNPVERAGEQREFILRGVASLEEARRTGVYYSSQEVLAEMRTLLDRRKMAERAETQKRLEDAFGLWSEPKVDGQEYQQALRQEWDILTGRSPPLED
ncbi:histidine ammonia-lyase [Rhizobium petrolearium]|uniref:hypothetical protein n=1 Tax=Neorhizobium petrolearium TaxID=515361 RepID=UPI001AE42855|nr:hypothetical protein [Neorhizobium petrolearium]MBP1842499.1 histidine ammonia-lyase [Neorhizobium petrolearium]